MATGFSGSNCIVLGPLDHVAPRNIPQSIIYLSLNSNVSYSDASSHLLQGLRRTISQVPWLAGRMYEQDVETPGWRPGQLEIRYGVGADPATLLRSNILDTSLSFPDLREDAFALNTFTDGELLWNYSSDGESSNGSNVFAAQANFVAGGCVLALSIAPPVSDGTAMLTVTKLWADNCASAFSTESLSVAGGLSLTVERSILHPVLAGASVTAAETSNEPESYAHLVGLADLGSCIDDLDKAVRPAMSPRLFYMPQPLYSSLRADCINLLGLADISGTDLISAVIWRSVMRAWVDEQSQVRPSSALPDMATLAIPFDGRPEMATPLGSVYLGNVNFENVIELPLKQMVACETTIPRVAHHIRASTTAQSTLSMLTNAYRLLQHGPAFDNQLRASRALPEMAAVGILSPMVLPFNETCFGKDIFGNSGKPEAFRPMMGRRNTSFRTCFVIPRKQHGGIEFVMTLSDHEMEFLERDDEFNRYAYAMS